MMEDTDKISKLIEKLDCSNIFPPKISAHKLLITRLNKDGLPPRSMNCFFCFRHVIYLELVQQKLIDCVKDGVCLTKIASVIWRDTSEENRKYYKDLAVEIKNLQISFHKDKTYCKNRSVGPMFVGKMNDDTFIKPKPIGKKIKRNLKKSHKKQENTKINFEFEQTTLEYIIDQNSQQIPYDLSLSPNEQLYDLNVDNWTYWMGEEFELQRYS